MNELLKTALSLSVSGSLLILVQLACGPLLRGRVSRRWRYFIARLPLPLSPAESPVGALFQGRPAQERISVVPPENRGIPDAPSPPPAAQNDAWERAEAGVCRPVELYVNRMVSSPMLLGVFRSCIVLPSTALTEEDFRFTVLHELTHFRR